MTNILSLPNNVYYEICQHLCPSERFMFKRTCKRFYEFIKHTSKSFKPLNCAMENIILRPLGWQFNGPGYYDVSLYYSLTYCDFIKYVYVNIFKCHRMDFVDGYTGKELKFIIDYHSLADIISFDSLYEILCIFHDQIRPIHFIMDNKNKVKFVYGNIWYMFSFIMEPFFEKYNIRYKLERCINITKLCIKELHSNENARNVCMLLLTNSEYEYAKQNIKFVIQQT